MLNIDEIKLVKQTGRNDCVPACLSMVTGIPLAEIISELGTPVDDKEAYMWLVRNDILAIRQSDLISAPFFQGNAYLAGCLSKHTKQPHSILIVVIDDIVVLDPNGEWQSDDIGEIPIYCLDRLVDCNENNKAPRPRNSEHAKNMLSTAGNFLENNL